MLMWYQAIRKCCMYLITASFSASVTRDNNMFIVTIILPHDTQAMVIKLHWPTTDRTEGCGIITLY